MSKTSSIWQTNSVLAFGGMQHSFFCQGLSSFFLKQLGQSRVKLNLYIPALSFYLPINAKSIYNALEGARYMQEQQGMPLPLLQRFASFSFVLAFYLRLCPIPLLSMFVEY